MEPLAVMVEMSRDTGVYDVDGALQIGKVYRSGGNEFFGTMWPSIKGKPAFLGKIYEKHNKPRVRYFDPDTCEIIDEIPKCLKNLESFNGTEDYDFLKDCYSRDENFLKESISDKEKEKLAAILREHSFQEFKKVAESPSETNSSGNEL
jgi:hypothetical protein